VSKTLRHSREGKREEEKEKIETLQWTASTTTRGGGKKINFLQIVVRREKRNGQ
jgi:hypothetical protein